MDIIYEGLDPSLLARIRADGRDDMGNPLVPMVDDGDEWPLRCCLRLSQPGESVAVVSASPFPWGGPDAERGPVVVHADDCDGPAPGFPDYLLRRRQVVKAFGCDAEREHTQIYELNRLVEAGEGLPEAIAEVLADPRVEFVHTHNVLAQCWTMSARRAG